MRKIVYLPLDERPCNYDFPYLVTEGSENILMARPPIEAMGKKKQAAECRRLCDFLLHECRDADYLILALDTLLYGGIIPSRLHHSGREELAGRLDVLRRVKEINPKIRISAFSLIMRCPCYSDSSEEPDYYAECGREIFLYGQNEHKFKLGEITKDEYDKERARLSACLPYIEDYEERRATNLSLLSDTLIMVGEYIDEITILQDDSNARGYTAMDREQVLRIVKERGISLDTYPGADEGGMTLLSRAVCYLEGKKPKIFVAYPRDRAADVVPIYEDREIRKTVSAQIESAGGVQCFSEKEADFILFCNLNDERTYDVYLNETRQKDEGYIPGFTDRIVKTLDSGRGAAIADVAYCNAADSSFVLDLAKKTDVLKLWGYAGWNTSSNTLGTVICQGVLRYLYGNTETNRRFTAYRMMDDAIYSAIVRPEMREKYRDEDGALPESGECAKLITKRINEVTADKLPSIAKKYTVTDCHLPWQRLFEIGLKIKEIES